MNEAEMLKQLEQQDLCFECFYYFKELCEHPKISPFPFTGRSEKCKYRLEYCHNCTHYDSDEEDRTYGPEERISFWCKLGLRRSTCKSFEKKVTKDE